MSKAKRVLKSILCFALVFVMGGGSILSAFSLTASAAETWDIDTSNPLDDLQGSTIEGIPFSTEVFNYDALVAQGGKGVKILNFLEYRYGSEDYGLYIYYLAPKSGIIWDASILSYVSIQFGEAEDAEVYKLPVRYLTEAEDLTYNGRYVKLKVELTEEQKTLFLSILDENNRCYLTSDFEFRYRGAGGSLANPFVFSSVQKYTYSGYMPGCGDAGDESTLKCINDDKLESVTLNVTPTYYRTATSEKGKGYQKQLDSVFFSVPTRLIDTYGKLQRIKAEWYEYKTSPIIVTSNKDFYDAAKDYVGVYLPDGGYNGYNKDIGYSLFTHDLHFIVPSVTMTAKATWGWNVPSGYLVDAYSRRLTYLFYTKNLETYDYTKKYEVTPDVTTSELLEHMYSYNSSSASPWYPTASGKIVSGDLFESDIDEARKINNEAGCIQMGYSYYDFDADLDLQTLRTWSSTDPSFWDNLLEWGFLDALTGGPEEKSRECAPIYIVSASDMVGTDVDIAERLMIDVDDVPALRREYSNAKDVSGTTDEEMEVVLFRFAVSDYYSVPITIVGIDADILLFDTWIEDQAYMAQESVFLNFDIIQLTFRLHGVDTVIPVVAKPIDVVADITPPIVSDPTERMNELLEAVLKIVGLIVFVVMVIAFFIIGKPILKLIWIVIKGVWYFVTYPFKLLRRWLRRRFRKK